MDLKAQEQLVHIDTGTVTLGGNLLLPLQAKSIVLFAHGSGSSRHSPRNKYVAKVLFDAGMATLLMDLLTHEEEVEDMRTMRLRFNIELLAERLANATDWILKQPDTSALAVGYFGASTGAAAALYAASERPGSVRAIVSRGGRPDLAEPVLAKVKAPTLLIVGGEDAPVIGMNKRAYSKLSTTKKLEIVPGATHLFEEPGALEQVANLACQWFSYYLNIQPGSAEALS